MAKNKIDDLRNHLFETIEALKDKEAPMDLDRARAIAGVAQTIINSAKVEVEFAKAIHAAPESPFFNQPDESRLLDEPEEPVLSRQAGLSKRLTMPPEIALAQRRTV